MSARFSVRCLVDDDVTQYYRMGAAEFMAMGAGSADMERQVTRVRRRDEGLPGFLREQRRGVVVDGEVRSAYQMYERWMRLGECYLPVGCISGVVTLPRYRGLGMGRAAMEDAIAHAIERRLALLMLDGVPDYYARFGFADIFDDTVHGIDRRVIPARVEDGFSVRPARIQDAHAISDLYTRHNSGVSGSFDWPLEAHAVRLRSVIDRGTPPLLAADATGEVRGCFYALPGSEEASEVLTDTWPAALHFLHVHLDSLGGGSDAPTSLRWRMRPASRTLYLLAEHLTAPFGEPRRQRTRSIVSVSRQRRDEGWVARPAHLPTLVERMLPTWQRRTQQCRVPYSGGLAFRIGDERFTLTVTGNEVELTDGEEDPELVALSPQGFMQLLFGFRPVWWIAEREELALSPGVRETLDTLLPPEPFWIPGVDTF